MERRRHHQLQATGQIEGDALSAEWQMGSVVIKRADGKDQARIIGEQATDFWPGKAAQPQ